MNTANNATPRLPKAVALAMFLTAMVVLVLQIALTRIMSVTVSYHSAFVVLSIVMLGLATSAIAAYRDITRARDLTLDKAISAAFRAAVITVVALLAYVHLVSADSTTQFRPLRMLLAATVFYAAFYYAGYVIAFLLTRFARVVGRLYWFDLCGAAVGCLAVVPLLNAASAPNAVLLCAVGAAVAGICLAHTQGCRIQMARGYKLTATLMVLLGAALLYPVLTSPGAAWGRRPLWEAWNSLARVAVYAEVPIGAGPPPASDEDLREQTRLRAESGWGTSNVFDGRVAPLLWLELDTHAGTQIIGRADAEAAELDFLKWDVTAAAYWLAEDHLDRTFVVGGGGGRDVLTATLFGAGDVDVVELNPVVVDAVQNRFGDFSGRLYDLPNVHLDIGEARSHLSRNDQRYDLIQMSMIDTWASSVAGSLVLSEHTLYTQEAFELFIEHLTDDGLLSISRWYSADHFAELGRALRLMASALSARGAERPHDHIAVLYNQGSREAAVATCILKRTPFTASDIQTIAALNERMDFTLLWPEVPGVTAHEVLDVNAVLTPTQHLAHAERFDFSPPTDDRPFFFNIDRPIASWVEALRSGDLSRGSQSTTTFAVLLLTLSIVVALITRRLQRDRATDLGTATGTGTASRSAILYFAGIGAGFMLVELALIQRYIVFLGHPTYAMTVVLFALLMFSAVGSLLSERVVIDDRAPTMRLALVGVLAGIAITAFVVPAILEYAHPWPAAGRVCLAVLLIAPLALCMGMIFPMGVRLLTHNGTEALIPYMWGINGITSVLASVLGTWAAMTWGYTTVCMLACAAYTLPLAAAGRKWAAQRDASTQPTIAPHSAATGVDGIPEPALAEPLGG